MEIILAVLLFFGGFSLGSISTDKGDDEAESTMALPDVNDASASSALKPITHPRIPTRCHSNQSIIYRDLSVPYRRQIEHSVIEVSDCEAGGDCSDNPSTRSSSMEIKHPDE